MLAEDYKTDDEIAAEIGIGKRALCGWKKHPTFDERVQSLVKKRRERMYRYRLARDEENMADLQRAYELHEQVRAERAADPTMASVPGGTTGLIVRDFKSVGTGESARVVPVYTEDHGWFKTLTSLQDQARKLLGIPEKHELTGKDGEPLLNVVFAQQWTETRTFIFQALDDYPEAKAALVQRLGEATQLGADE